MTSTVVYVCFYLHHKSTNDKNQYMIYFLEVVLCAFTFSHFLVVIMWLIILPHDYLLFIIFGSEHRSP